jgi:hypothetical protein
MSLQISPETEARLNLKAEECGVSVDELLKRLLTEAEHLEEKTAKAPEFPKWNLGVIGSLRRADIYDDVE